MYSDDESSGDESPGPLQSMLPDMAPGRKKKRGMGKTAASRGPTAMAASRGTGFEGTQHLLSRTLNSRLITRSEYFADPPVTPEEAQDERLNVYALDLPFHE